jgi:hypothetical protein
VFGRNRPFEPESGRETERPVGVGEGNGASDADGGDRTDVFRSIEFVAASKTE